MARGGRKMDYKLGISGAHCLYGHARIVLFMIKDDSNTGITGGP